MLKRRVEKIPKDSSLVKAYRKELIKARDLEKAQQKWDKEKEEKVK